ADVAVGRHCVNRCGSGRTRMSGSGRQTFWQSFGETSTVLSLIMLYCAVEFCARVLGSPNLNAGEATSVLFGQSLQWSYLPSQPPLMTWLAWATLSLSRNSKLALFLLREVVLLFGFIAYFAAARRVVGDSRRGTLSVLLLFATFGMGWLPQNGR